MDKQQNKIPEVRFPEFEGDWEVKKFSEFIKLYRGSSPRPINRYLTNKSNGVSWIKIGDTKNVTTYTIESVSQKITYEGSLKSRKVSRGELILANSMSFGKTYLLEIEGCIYDGWFVLREYDKYFDKQFLIQLLNSEILQKQYKRLSTGGVVQNISSDIVYSTILSKPTLPEQKKIAHFFSVLDKKLTQLQEKKTALELYKKGMMQKIFAAGGKSITNKPITNYKSESSEIVGSKSRKSEFLIPNYIRFKDDNGKDFPDWEVKKLGEVCDVRDGTHDSPKYVTNGYPLLTSKNLLANGNIDLTNVNLISQFDYENINKRSGVSVGDILFGMIGTIGNPVILKEIGFAIKNVALIKEENDLLNNFLIHYLSSNKILKQFYEQNTGGTQKFIALGVIRSLKIQVPTLLEQTKIANFLSKIDDKINTVTEKIEQTKEYKKGLLQKMFV